MNKPDDRDSAWLGWIEVQRRAAILISQGDRAAAFSEVEAFLSRERNPELRSDALGLRAQFKERAGDLQGAKEDLSTALSLIGPTYLRYVHELCLGSICEEQQQIEEALSWYRNALETSLECSDVSGGSALQSYLRLRGQNNLNPQEKGLCRQVIAHSWKLLRLPGKPNLTNLAIAADAIKAGEAQPPEAFRRRQSKGGQ